MPPVRSGSRAKKLEDPEGRGDPDDDRGTDAPEAVQAARAAAARIERTAVVILWALRVLLIAFAIGVVVHLLR